MDTLLSISVLGDQLAKIKQNLIFFPASYTLANVQTFLTTYAPLLDTITDGKIVDATVAFSLTLPGGLKGSPVTDSDARMAARMSYANGSRYAFGNYIPGIGAAYRVGGVIDPTDTDVAAVIDAMVTGLSTFAPTNGEAFDLTAFNKVKLSLLK